MSLLIEEKENFTIAPAGVHPAKCVWCIDIGIQETLWGARHQIILGYELVNESLSEDKNYLLSKWYGASMSKKSVLRATAAALLGKDVSALNITDLLGKPCLVTVEHVVKGDQTFPKIMGASALPKGLAVAEAKTPLLAYDLDAPDPDVYEALPQWVKTRISYAKVEGPKEEASKGTHGIPAVNVSETIPF